MIAVTPENVEHTRKLLRLRFAFNAAVRVLQAAKGEAKSTRQLRDRAACMLAEALTEVVEPENDQAAT